MKLEHMTGPEHPLYAAAWALYEAAFPANERRDAEWQARALAQDAYHMCAAAEDGALCAIAFYWMHGGELFLEHLAVASELRGRGIGAALLAFGIQLPIDYGYGGAIYLKAKTTQLREHYMRNYGAIPFSRFDPFLLLIDGDAARELFGQYLKEV